MFEVNEILDLLRSGTDIATLAQQAADSLNAAQEKYKEEQEIIKRQKEEEERKYAHKRAAAVSLITDMAYYFFNYCPGMFKNRDEVEDFIASTDIDEIMTNLEEVAAAAVKFKQILGTEFNNPAQKTPKKPKKDFSDAIESFLKENNLF